MEIEVYTKDEIDEMVDLMLEFMRTIGSSDSIQKSNAKRLDIIRKLKEVRRRADKN